MRLFIISIIVALSLLTTTIGSTEAKSNDETKKIDPKRLEHIINNHQEWLKDYDTEEKRSAFTIYPDNDYRRAKLEKENLTDARLIAKNLTSAVLDYANLSGAKLGGSNFTDADMSLTNLTGANLWGTNLTGAIMEGANLTNASLLETNLTGASLEFANLTGAGLLESNLSGTILNEANLKNTIFEPNTLPPTDFIANAKNLHTMTYIQSPQALVKLRKAFRDAGFREQERAITYAINHSGEWLDKSLLGKIEGAFKHLFLDLPTQWGMYPGRALRILLILIIVFSFPYIITIRQTGKSGIYRKLNEYSDKQIIKENDIERLHYKGLNAVSMGFYFSVLSAFNIGFREINIGNWITKLQPRDYTFYSEGWVRSISGLQSLISLYLIAMWVLTYFGRPFG